MKARELLHPPASWDHFEDLCKKLWGEIWACEESIKKNGRNGQAQHGVDVYGLPSGRVEYCGIQCKGKDTYFGKQFTEDEIVKEIEAAKSFKPALKKLIFATTAQKDARIEEFVRVKNIESLNNELFEIDIFSWEDITDLIYDNRRTYDWYVRSLNFKSNKAVSITFHDGSTELVIKPRFKRLIPMPVPKRIIDMYKIARPPAFLTDHVQSKSINHSLDDFSIHIKNIGSDTLEEYKLIFEFKDEIQELAYTNVTVKGIVALSRVLNIPYQPLRLDNNCGSIIPERAILVGDDIFKSAKIFVKPLAKDYDVPIHWKFLAKDFKCEGVLTLKVLPLIDKGYKEVPEEEESQAVEEMVEVIESTD